MRKTRRWSWLPSDLRHLVPSLGLIVLLHSTASADTKQLPLLPDTAQEKEAAYVPGELLVKFRESATEGNKAKLHSKNGGQKLKEYKGLRLQRVKLKANDKVRDAAKRYQGDPDVEYAEPNYLVGLKKSSNDPLLSMMSGLTKIKAQQAWDATTGSPNVVVAILDTGLDYNHPDLKDNVWINSWDPASGGDNDANGYIDDVHGINAITGGGNVLDDHGHGTHVAGTIGATGNNGTGVVGVNWTVKLLPCKVLNSSGQGSVADSVESLTYLKALKERTQDPVNLAVVNASWAFDQYSYSLYDAIKAMGDTLFVAAAGNEAANSEVTPAYPANYRLPNVISVAATTSTDALAPFSNYGKNLVDVGAPGFEILSTYPNASYAISSGTSMAAPHVSGLAALLKAQDPTRDGRKIKNLILSSGESLTTLAGKSATGKRIDAAAATACFDKPLLSPGRLPFPASAGSLYTLTARSLNCDSPVGPVTVTTSAGETVVLSDEGTLGDAESGDGIFSANWTPATMPVTLTFSSPAGSRSVTLPPLKASFHIADARVNVPYYQSLGVEGGIPPYVWSIQSGVLPSGLSFNPATGVISGTATATTVAGFSAEVTDARGDKAAADVSLRVVTEPVDQNWGRAFGGDGNDEGRAVTSDPSGNLYVSGKIYNGVNFDLFLSKYDPSGELLWTRTSDRGGDETGQSVARDLNGDIYVAGYSANSRQEAILLKYSAAGELLWSNASTLTAASMAHPAVALDGAGNAYLVSPGYLQSNEAVQIEKFTPAGTRVWSKTHQEGSVNLANAVAVDPSGNIYFGGGVIKNGYWNYLLAKYDASGNYLWTRSAAEGANSFIEGIALDASGNLVAAGWSSGGASYGFTVKYDPAGNQLWKSTTPTGYLLRGVATAATGIYVTGELQSGATADFVTLKYDHSGSELWKKSLDAGRREAAYGVAADAGGVTVVGYGESGDNEEVLLARYSDNSGAVNDLTLTAFSASLSGSTLTYNLTVKNNGTGNASAAIGLYLSADNVPATADHLVTYLSAGNLAGGAERTLTGTVIVPISIPSGTFYPAAIADPGGVVDESNEANNGAIETQSYSFASSGSDLTVTDVTGSVASGVITYSVTVANGGNLAAGASSTTLYLWSGGTVITLENPLTTINTPALAAGAQSVLTGSVSLPPTMPQGNYFLLATADSRNQIAEQNETNNGGTGSQITLTNDLTISALSSSLNGGTFSYSITVQNLGNASADVPLSFYLSGDATASANDILIRQVAAGTIAGGSSKTLTGTITIPSSVGPGSYYFAALVDPANVVPETNESNNGAVGELRPLASDLKVTGFSATLSGGRINYSLTVKNIGNLASPPASSSLYLSSDAVASTSDLELVSFITLATAPGAERTTTASVSLPQTVAPGSYRAAAIVDTSNLVAEWDETNNSAVGDLFSFANDVTVKGLSGTLTAGVLSYSLTVGNSGSGSAVVPVLLYLSPDASISGNDPVIREIAGVNVAGGTEKLLTGTLAVPATIPNGTYYLAAMADPANVLPESNEQNNGSVATGAFTITSDLQVTTVSATLAAGKLTYSVTLKNAGTIGTPSSQTGLYLSADGVPSTSDFLVSNISTQGIAAGAERVVTGSVALPATIPAGSYGVAAIADSMDILKETVETNNSAMGNQVTLANDLSLASLSGTVSAGVLSYTVTVRNSGTGSVTAPVFLYLSPDASASTDDIVIKQLSASSLGGGTEKVLTGTVAIPGTVPSGAYYLTAVADPASAVAEANEANNGAVAERITVTSDLDVTAVSATLAGGKLTYSIVVKNYGSVGTPTTKTGLYFSADGIATTSDLLVSSISTSSIAYGAERVLTGSVAVPAGIASGTYYVTAIADADNLLLEGTEGNNAAVGNQVTLVDDLSLTNFSGTLSAGVLSYTVTVRNSGTGSVSAPVYLYLSADGAASVNDLVLKQLSAGIVPGGTEKTLTGSFAVPGTVPGGSYYLAALVDPAGAVPESNEGNNGAVAENFTITSDLRVTQVAATLAGGKLTYSVTVKNAGNIGTPFTSTGLYFSVDGVASTDDLLLSSISTSAIPYGGEKVLTGSVTVPATVPSRSYYVTAVADATNVVSETVETGNAWVGNLVTLSNDLSFSAFSGSLSNGILSYSMTVKNSGTGNPPVAAKLLFSTDNTASVNDILLKDLSAGSIPGGTEKVVSGTITLPGTIPSGTYYLAALADPANAVAETVESNNAAVASQFTVNSDLRVVAVSATVSGGRATYSVTVRNGGNIASAASVTGLYLSTDAVAASSDILLAPISTAAVPPGTDKILTGTATVPTTVGPGSYYVAAIADTANGTPESVESNNSMTGNQVALSNDLSITAVSGTLTGGVLSYSVTVANTGNLNPAVPVALSFSTDAVPSANDYQLRVLSGSVPGGTEKVLTGTVTIPGSVPTGSFYLAALADPDGSVPESNESNNGRAGVQFAVNSDLRVTAVSGSIAAGVLSYSVTVTNAGNIAAAASSTGVYLSADSTPSLSDYRVASLSPTAIPAGGVKVLTGRVTIPATVPAGSYYLAGIADIAGEVIESAEGNNGAVGGTVVR